MESTDILRPIVSAHYWMLTRQMSVISQLKSERSGCRAKVGEKATASAQKTWAPYLQTVQQRSIVYRRLSCCSPTKQSKQWKINSPETVKTRAKTIEPGTKRLATSTPPPPIPALHTMKSDKVEFCCRTYKLFMGRCEKKVEISGVLSEP